MPRFSANLGFLWRELPLLRRIELAAAAGFRAVELHWPYDTPAAAVGAACRRHGLTLLGINTEPGDLASGEFGLAALPGREADFRAALERSVDWCLASGAGMIHAMAGVVKDDERRIARRTLLANLDRAADLAAGHGLTLLLEAINRRDRPGYFYHRAREAAEIVTELGRPNVRLMLDAYHAGMEGDDPAELLPGLVPLVAHVQVAAVPSRAEPDEGDVDYARFFSALEEAGYSGWIGCEYLPRATVEEGLGWMKRLAPDG